MLLNDEGDTRRMQAAELRMNIMMCEKTLRNEIPHGLLRDRTRGENIENHVRETRLRWLGQLERMDETKLVRRIMDERVLGHMK